MELDLSALGAGFTENWFSIALIVVTALYGKWGRPPNSRGIWCPNVVSLLATIICLIGYYLFIENMQHLGIMIYATGEILDLVDGNIARQHDKKSGSEKSFTSFKAAFWHLGTSQYGALWDSSMDKVRTVLIFSHISFLAFDQDFVLVAVLFASIVLIDLISGIRKLSKFKIQKKNGGNNSGHIGKIKSLFHQVLLLPWVFLPLVGETILTWTLVVTLFLTASSLVSALFQSHVEVKT